MEKIEYFSPKENIEREDFYGQSFELIIDGKKIGAAEINYHSKPLPLYQLTDLYVDAEESGKGYASQLMDKVEAFLKGRKKPGVLVDAIDLDSPASGMYERRGWAQVSSVKDLYVFNWPPDVNLDILRGYPSRYTDYLTRPNTF